MTEMTELYFSSDSTIAAMLLTASVLLAAPYILGGLLGAGGYVLVENQVSSASWQGLS